MHYVHQKALPSFSHLIPPFRNALSQPARESGYEAEVALLGGVLVCDWLKGQAYDMARIQRLTLRDDAGQLYELSNHLFPFFVLYKR